MKKAPLSLILAFGLLLGCAGPSLQPPELEKTTGRGDPTLGGFPSPLSPEEREEFELARRGFMGTDPALEIRGPGGNAVWDMKAYEFLGWEKPAPDTVNPALWRHAQRNALHGLFRVTDRIYQVRGYDLAVMTFIQGETGYIVVDPLISTETARAALELFYRHLPRKPVVAVIYTHNHVDHWGGVKGVVSEEEAKAGRVRILAPEGFLREAVSENIMAGNAMARRATYMFGTFLEKGPRGQVDAGVGKTASQGTVSLIPPTEEISRTGQELTVDGVSFVFQLVPGSEAPVGMNFYLPGMKALCLAEICTAALHNFLTPRGAPVRDGRAWARFIDEALELFGDRAEVVFNTHHWPRWGKEKIRRYLKNQRDLYKYIHDQTVRLMNHGHTMTECAERIQLPPGLAGEVYNRDFYGTVNFNVKAVYQKYLGWFDGNPANLHPLPPGEAAKRYVEFMGGSAAVLERARAYFQKGEYRWVAQVVNHVVFAEPENQEARELQARTLEQLGFQAESPVWRNFYLSGARELRKGPPRVPMTWASLDLIRSLPLDAYFDYLAILLNGPKAAGKKITVDWVFTDTQQEYSLTLENGVLNHRAGRRTASPPDATLYLTRGLLDSISARKATFPGRILSGDIRIEGSTWKFLELLSCLDQFEFWFPLVSP